MLMISPYSKIKNLAIKQYPIERFFWLIFSSFQMLLKGENTLRCQINDKILLVNAVKPINV